MKRRRRSGPPKATWFPAGPGTGLPQCWLPPRVKQPNCAHHLDEQPRAPFTVDRNAVRASATTQLNEVLNAGHTSARRQRCLILLFARVSATYRTVSGRIQRDSIGLGNSSSRSSSRPSARSLNTGQSDEPDRTFPDPLKYRSPAAEKTRSFGPRNNSMSNRSTTL